jgi:hypothetical protein
MAMATSDGSDGAEPAVRQTLDDSRLVDGRDSDGGRELGSLDQLRVEGRALGIELEGGAPKSRRVGKCGSRLGLERPGGSDGCSKRGRALGKRKRASDIRGGAPGAGAIEENRDCVGFGVPVSAG